MSLMLRGAAHLELVCRRCTRVAIVPAPNAKQAADAAIAEGWSGDGAAFSCPKCSHVVEPKRAASIKFQNDLCDTVEPRRAMLLG